MYHTHRSVRLGRLSFIVALLTAAALPLAAQPTNARAVELGRRASGVIQVSDPRWDDRGGFHSYRLEVKAGGRYDITMRSDDFDAYLSVVQYVGGMSEKLVTDDDSGGDTDAKLRFRAPAAGTYYIVAQSLEADGLGAYSLEVAEAPPPVPVVATELSMGKAVEGSIGSGSPMLEDENPPIPFQLYTYRGSGERVRISMRSGAFDTFLRVTRVTADGETELATDDDGGGGTDASLAVVADGRINIYARPLDASASGTFSLSLVDAPMAKVITRSITVGQTITGAISLDDPEMPDGTHFHEYAISGTAGQRIRITLRSEDFDAFLTASRPGTTFTAGDTDDDSGGGTDAQLDLAIPESGTILVRAHTLGTATGNYTLQVVAR